MKRYEIFASGLRNEFTVATMASVNFSNVWVTRLSRLQGRDFQVGVLLVIFTAEANQADVVALKNAIDAQAAGDVILSKSDVIIV